MREFTFVDKPAILPATQVKGSALKPITQVLLERRATPHFLPDPVPAEYLDAILKLATQAPSGYNIQPWRFVVIQDAANRQNLQKAAYNQPKVGEAPVMIVAFSIPEEWKASVDAVFNEGVKRGLFKAEAVEKTKQGALQFIGSLDPKVWMNRHTMIAFATLMLAAESYGLDTAPMEGFDPAAVKKTLGLPESSEVIALLALGFAKEPDKNYGGRLALSETVHSERYGVQWHGTKS